MNRAEFAKTSITTVKANLARTILTIQSGSEDLEDVIFVSNHAGATAYQVRDSLNINDIELTNRQSASNNGSTFTPAIGVRAQAAVGAINEGAKSYISPNSGLQGTLMVPQRCAYNFEINSEVDVVFEQGTRRFNCDRQLTIASRAGSISLDGLEMSFDNVEFSFNRRGDVYASVAVVSSDNPIRMQSEILPLNVIGLQAPSYETQGDVRIA